VETGKSQASDSALGTLVHRLLQRLGVRHDVNPAGVTEMAHRILGSIEDGAIEDVDALAERAATVYGALVRRPEVAAVYSAGAIFHEVPFASVSEGRVVRGVIDCVAQLGPNRLTVLEFKTGRPRSWHREQLEAYRQAVGAVFPTAEVDGQLVYPGGDWPA
jgi:ATP-dependent exoDNAse (exonuclease V) beta subunit